MKPRKYRIVAYLGLLGIPRFRVQSRGFLFWRTEQTCLYSLDEAREIRDRLISYSDLPRVIE